jgi:hypothetical protein
MCAVAVSLLLTGASRCCWCGAVGGMPLLLYPVVPMCT